METTSIYRPVRGSGSRWAWLLLLVLVATMLLPMYAGLRSLLGFRTLTYEVTADELIIHYAFERVRIGTDQITRLYEVTPTQARRVMGTGLPGLQQGRWTFAETGPIFLYSTSIRQATVIETAEGRWGISPADPVAFSQALTDGRAGRFEPISVMGFGGLVPLMLLSLLLPLAVILLISYLMTIARSMTYTLNQDTLVIRLGFTRTTVPYTAISQAVVAAPDGMPLRTFGAGLPGLLWGRFFWKSVGPNLRLYATQYKPLVLIYTDKMTYGITPEAMEGFVKDLQGRMSTPA